MDKWKTEGHDQASPCYRLLYKEYKDTPEQPELQHLGVCRQNNNNNNDNNNKKKINKTWKI